MTSFSVKVILGTPMNWLFCSEMWMITLSLALKYFLVAVLIEMG